MARKIYKTTDKISIKIDDLTVKISPLSFDVKTEVQMEILSGKTMGIVNAARMAIKHGLKEIEGLENPDGSLYELQFEGGVLTDACIDDLLNVDQDDKLSLVCTAFLNGIPKGFVNPDTGQPIEGIKIETGAAPKKKK